MKSSFAHYLNHAIRSRDRPLNHSARLSSCFSRFCLFRQNYIRVTLFKPCRPFYKTLIKGV
jgi:hypothetical protein